MSLCASCLAKVDGESELCLHHTIPEAQWAEVNRIICGFVRRGIVPERLNAADRTDPYASTDNLGDS